MQLLAAACGGVGEPAAARAVPLLPPVVVVCAAAARGVGCEPAAARVVLFLLMVSG